MSLMPVDLRLDSLVMVLEFPPLRYDSARELFNLLVRDLRPASAFAILTARGCLA